MTNCNCQIQLDTTCQNHTHLNPKTELDKLFDKQNPFNYPKIKALLKRTYSVPPDGNGKPPESMMNAIAEGVLDEYKLIERKNLKFCGLCHDHIANTKWDSIFLPGPEPTCVRYQYDEDGNLETIYNYSVAEESESTYKTNQLAWYKHKKYFMHLSVVWKTPTHS